MNVPQTVSGTRLFISATLPLLDALAGYAPIVFTQIRGVRILGDIPISHQTRERNIMDSTAVKTVATGAMLYPVVPIEVYRINDAGQALLNNSINSMQAYTFKIERADGSGLYFQAKTLKKVIALGDSSNLHTKPFELAFDSLPIEFD